MDMIGDWKVPALIGCGIVALLVAWIQNRSSTSNNPKGLQYPPGPKKLPIFGSAFHLPKLSQWLAFTQWAQSFGQFQLPADSTRARGR